MASSIKGDNNQMRSAKWFLLLTGLFLLAGCNDSTELSEADNKKLKNDFQTSIKSIDEVPAAQRERVRGFMEAAKNGAASKPK
jgi:hypothetical protein